jgi:hypothetical protein
MDLNKIEEMQRVLDQHRRELKKEEQAQAMVKELSGELRDMSMKLKEMVDRVQGIKGSAFYQYHDALREALCQVMRKFNLSKKELSVEVGVSDMAMYTFINHGYKRYTRSLFDRVESYLTKHGYDIAAMKQESGYTHEDI